MLYSDMSANPSCLLSQALHMRLLSGLAQNEGPTTGHGGRHSSCRVAAAVPSPGSGWNTLRAGLESA